MSTYHHGSLRPALLRAAGKTLEKEGAGALSLRAAARNAGVSHNAPYRHFEDRDALLAALAAEGFELLGEAMRDHSGREMGEAYVRFALTHPQRFRLMFGGVLPMAQHPQLGEAASRAYEALLGAFKELPNAELAAAAAWSLVHGLAHLVLDGHFAAAQKAAGGAERFAAQVIGTVRFAQRAG
jgi:AcrR family transcriptional regulator